MRTQRMPRRRNRACNAPTGIDRQTRACAIQGAGYSCPDRERVPKHPHEEQDEDSPGYRAADPAGEAHDPWRVTQHFIWLVDLQEYGWWRNLERGQFRPKE